MGWFDEDDSDEEEDQQQQQQQQQEQELGDNNNDDGDDDDEEVDPLDAYMKSLIVPKAAASTGDTTTDATAAASTPAQRRSGRLDVDNEDEATSHWHTQLQSSSSSKNDMEDYEDDHDHEQQQYLRQDVASSKARHALDSTFHRAGRQQSKTDRALTWNAAAVQHTHQEKTSHPRHVVQTSFWKPSDTSRGHTWRNQHQVTCVPGTVDPIYTLDECSAISINGVFDGDDGSNNKSSNSDSNINSSSGGFLWTKLLEDAVGIVTPTLVQSQTWPVALSGSDALVTASTGSGKTLAYVLPLLVHCWHQHPHGGGGANAAALDDDEDDSIGPMALVLVPTRELATQVHKQVKRMLVLLSSSSSSAAAGRSKNYNLTSLAITGGISNYHLLKDIGKTGDCHVIVATPGRFLDLLGTKGGKNRRRLSLHRVTLVVLDEADKMLDLGFEKQVTEILKNIRPDRQSLLLSATMGKKVERLAQQWLTDPFRIAVGRTGDSSEHVEQHVMVLPSYEKKRAWLMEMLPVLSNVGRTLLFVATRTECEELAQAVRPLSLRVETLHGDKHQSDRSASLRSFSKGKLDALIATDVAARGLDVQNVSTVINFDPAKNLDAHVHRIGRAGRLSEGAHKKGVAYTLLTHKNADFAHVLMNAFEREGRQVTNELKTLAGKSRRSGNVASRTKFNKAGLGFDDNDASHYGPSTSQQAIDAPPAKRSRFS